MGPMGGQGGRAAGEQESRGQGGEDEEHPTRRAAARVGVAPHASRTGGYVYPGPAADTHTHADGAPRRHAPVQDCSVPCRSSPSSSQTGWKPMPVWAWLEPSPQLPSFLCHARGTGFLRHITPALVPTVTSTASHSVQPHDRVQTYSGERSWMIRVHCVRVLTAHSPPSVVTHSDEHQPPPKR